MYIVYYYISIVYTVYLVLANSHTSLEFTRLSFSL